MVRGLNGIQAKKLTESYIGKWIRASRVVSSVHVAGFEVYLHFGQIFDGDLQSYFEASVTARFSEVAEGLEILTHGDSVTVVGEIQKVTSEGLILANCELAS